MPIGYRLLVEPRGSREFLTAIIDRKMARAFYRFLSYDASTKITAYLVEQDGKLHQIPGRDLLVEEEYEYGSTSLR